MKNIQYGRLVDIEPLGNAVIHYHTKAYKQDFLGLSNGDQRVAHKIFEIMEDGLNTFQVGGETMEWLKRELDMNEQSIRDCISRIKKATVIEPTEFRGEYIVDPLICHKGRIDEVWLNYIRIEKEVSND